MRISLIVATRNRADWLRATLDAVFRIQDPDWETVVVDNGSGDHTQAVIDHARRSTPVSLQSVTEPRPGLARARNRGVEASSGELLAFTDDDCYPGTEHLTRLRAWFANDSVGFVGGRVVLHDPTDLPIKILLEDRQRRFAPGTFVPSGRVIGANMAVRRRALQQIGGFDPLLSGDIVPSGDDLDVLGRLAAEGWEGVYDPDLVVRHHHRYRRWEDTDGVSRAYDLGRGACMFKLLRYRTVRREMLGHWWERTHLIRDRRKIRNEVEGAIRYAIARWRS